MGSSQGTRERSADEGSGGKGEGESTVAHARSIGNEDVQDDIDRIISNAVKNVPSTTILDGSFAQSGEPKNQLLLELRNQQDIMRCRGDFQKYFVAGFRWMN
jgi:hypothetical protein